MLDNKVSSFIRSCFFGCVCRVFFFVCMHFSSSEISCCTRYCFFLVRKLLLYQVFMFLRLKFATVLHHLYILI